MSGAEIKYCYNCLYSCEHWCKHKKRNGYYRCFYNLSTDGSPKEVFKNSNCKNWKIKKDE